MNERDFGETQPRAVLGMWWRAHACSRSIFVCVCVCVCSNSPSMSISATVWPSQKVYTHCYSYIAMYVRTYVQAYVGLCTNCRWGGCTCTGPGLCRLCRTRYSRPPPRGVGYFCFSLLLHVVGETEVTQPSGLDAVGSTGPRHLCHNQTLGSLCNLIALCIFYFPVRTSSALSVPPCCSSLSLCVCTLLHQ